MIVIIIKLQLQQMRLSIRLQNHGKKNHPYWWIVVAPQHKNIFGRYTEHIGYWSPRHNVNIKRQIILNIPRLMYWLGNGAVPTFRIHKFLNMYGIFPKPWKYAMLPESAAELAEEQKKQKPYQEMTPKQKSLVDRKRKREARTQLHKSNYHRYEAYAMREHKLPQQLLGKQHDNQFENSVIRDMLHQADFHKYDRLAQLAGDSLDAKPTFEKLNIVREKLRKAKSQLALLERQYANSNHLHKSKIIQRINNLSKKLAQVQEQQSNLRPPEQPTNPQQFVSEDYLQNRLKYQLITKKLQKTQKQLQLLDTMFDPITVGEYAAKLQELKEKDPNLFEKDDDVMEIAKQEFQERAEELSPMTRMDILALDPQYTEMIYGDDDEDEYSPQPGDTSGSNYESYQYYLNQILTNKLSLPSIRPVHPRPDLRTYIPEQHYDPIDMSKLDVMMMDALDPHEELEKYKRKRNPEETVEDRKKRDGRIRMQRLRILEDGGN